MTVGDALCAAAIGMLVGTSVGWAMPEAGLWSIVIALVVSCITTHWTIRVLLLEGPTVR
jgi:hypothetical protein